MRRIPVLLFLTCLTFGCFGSSVPSVDGGPAADAATMADGGSMDGGPSCTEEACLCEDTGGRWDEGSCGHYSCGRPPLCDALIPGCDCGMDATFAEGAGCVADPGC